MAKINGYSKSYAHELSKVDFVYVEGAVISASFSITPRFAFDARSSSGITWKQDATNKYLLTEARREIVFWQGIICYNLLYRIRSSLTMFNIRLKQPTAASYAKLKSASHTSQHEHLNLRKTFYNYPIHLVLVNQSLSVYEKCREPIQPPAQITKINYFNCSY